MSQPIGDIVRILRIVEYIGPREAIEKQIENSIHGTRRFDHRLGPVTINAVTIGEFPEILERASAKCENP